MSAPKPGQFGEPLHRDSGGVAGWIRSSIPGLSIHFCICETCRGGGPDVSMASAMLDRMITAHNALDGRDPEALAGLIEAAEWTVNRNVPLQMSAPWRLALGADLVKLRAALAAFGVTK